jgi:hypothetical protein
MPSGQIFPAAELCLRFDSIRDQSPPSQSAAPSVCRWHGSAVGEPWTIFTAGSTASLRGVFAEQAIDLEVLPELTDVDLQQLGLPLGARRKLLKAIRELAGKPVPPPAGPAAAQRRQLTLLFCDLDTQQPH